MAAWGAVKARRKSALVLVPPQPNSPDQSADQSPHQAPNQASQQTSHQLPHLVTARDVDRPPLSIVAPSTEPIAPEAIVAKAIVAETVVAEAAVPEPIAIAPASVEPAAIAPAAVDRIADAPAGDYLISWGALGCPRETGAYIATGLDGAESNAKISVKLIHILAAENDPSALFTVVVLRPPLGPAMIMLGHRVA